MPSYFFHLYEACGECRDDQGVERASISDAIIAARAAARDIMSQMVRDGHLDLSARIEVELTSGEVAYSLPFHEAVTIVGI